jgi:hypothetical protein
VELSNVEEERTNQCCKRGSRRLTNCGHVRNWTQKWLHATCRDRNLCIRTHSLIPNTSSSH